MGKTHTALLAGTLALALAAPLAAQQFENVPQQAKPGAPAAAAPTAATARIGVIDIQTAMAQTQEGKKASQDLQAEFTPRQAALQKLQEEVRNLQSQLQSQERTLSDAARLQLSQELEKKRKDAQRAQQDLQDDAQAAQARHIQRIGSKMQQVIDRYGRENNLSVIINDSGNGLVIYAAPTVDITDAIVQLYDQTFPVETAPAAGAAKKPAAPATAQKPPSR